MAYLKYIFIPIIALGLALSDVLGIEYSCHSSQNVPDFFANPIIYKEKSLGSSMTYYFSFFGVLANFSLWLLVVILLRYLYLKILDKIKSKKIFKTIYKIAVVLLLLISLFFIWMSYLMMDSGFNQWHFDLEKEEQRWNVKCQRTSKQ